MHRPEFDIVVPLLNLVECPECGGNSEPQWESRRMLSDHTVEVSTVCHCWECDYDQEIIRIFNLRGNLLKRTAQRFFFG